MTPALTRPVPLAGPGLYLYRPRNANSPAGCGLTLYRLKRGPGRGGPLYGSPLDRGGYAKHRYHPVSRLRGVFVGKVAA